MVAKPTARRGMLAEGSFGAFVLDQLGALGGVEARPMFGGAGHAAADGAGEED